MVVAELQNKYFTKIISINLYPYRMIFQMNFKAVFICFTASLFYRFLILSRRIAVDKNKVHPASFQF